MICRQRAERIRVIAEGELGNTRIYAPASEEYERRADDIEAEIPLLAFSSGHGSNPEKSKNV
jgi:hypothetical protein